MQDKLKVQKTIDIDFEISVKDLAEAFALGTDFKQFTFLNFVAEEFKSWDEKVPMSSNTQLLNIASQIAKYSHDTTIDEWLQTLLDFIREERRKRSYVD